MVVSNSVLTVSVMKECALRTRIGTFFSENVNANIPLSLKLAYTYEQQIDRLKAVHKLTISDEKSARQILERVNYYRLSFSPPGC